MMLTLSNLSEHIEEIRRNRECVIYKPIGMTPLELVNECIRICGFEKGSFSGRLDPMAHGASMIVFDDKCKRSIDYHSLGKTYIFKFIIGIKTTSLDLLGFPTVSEAASTITPDSLRHFMEGIQAKGGYCQKLPDYCSYRVSNIEGVKQPLWWWAVNNRIKEINVPSFERKLFNYEIINGGDDNMSLQQISNIAIDRIQKIKSPGNLFNTSEIIKSWSDFTENNTPLQFFTIKVDVSSGFFIRSLVRDIGEAFGVDTMTLEIERIGYF
jgi:tRNA U55 pseudouridine synthase TruB